MALATLATLATLTTLATLATRLLELSLALPSATLPSTTTEYSNSSTTGGSAPNAWLQALSSYYDPLPPPQPCLLLQLLAKVATSKIAAKKGFSRVGLSPALHQEIH